VAQIDPETEKRQTNPDWTRDELILALDLYQDHPDADQRHPRVADLSKLLNVLWSASSEGGASSLRNANGVSMKLANFQRLDPVYIEKGRVGLTRGGRLEKEIWAEFSANPTRLRSVATAIRLALEAQPTLSVAEHSDSVDEVEAAEGAILTRLHRFRERDRKIVARKKASLAATGGRIECEACGFDFFEHYGERGLGFIEVHHLQPLEATLVGAKTRLRDLAALCANCHRMIHARRPWLTMEELRSLLGRLAN